MTLSRQWGIPTSVASGTKPLGAAALSGRKKDKSGFVEIRSSLAGLSNDERGKIREVLKCIGGGATLKQNIADALTSGMNLIFRNDSDGKPSLFVPRN